MEPNIFIAILVRYKEKNIFCLSKKEDYSDTGCVKLTCFRGAISGLSKNDSVAIKRRKNVNAVALQQPLHLLVEGRVRQEEVGKLQRKSNAQILQHFN